MKRKNIAFLLIICLMSLLIGCGINEDDMTKTQESASQDEGIITYETSELGIDSNDRDFINYLVSGTYYVVHDGIYYPAYKYFENNAAVDEVESFYEVNNERLVFYTTDNIKNIPTLFPGDHLVYYSTDNMLDHVIWERYKYLGTTFPMHGLLKNTAGKYYLNLDDSDNDVPNILPDTDLNDLYTLKIDNALIDKIGGVVINDDVVHNGIIIGASEDTNYDMDIYTGTQYKYYNVKANIQALEAYELFASIEMETLQDCFWEIKIPEYFKDGYYQLDNNGLIRYLTTDSYSKNTDYNEQILFPDVVDNLSTEIIETAENTYVAPGMYSTCPELNYFTQEHDSELLGYYNPEEEEQETEEDSDLPDAAKFKEANTITYDLWFPESRACRIVIKSKSDETTGNAVVTFDNGTSIPLTYNRFDKIYELDVNGKGDKGTITINGFWYDYNIELVNVEVYENQDYAPVDSDMESPNKEENNSEEVNSTEEISTEENINEDSTIQNNEEESLFKDTEDSKEENVLSLLGQKVGNVVDSIKK